MRHVSSRPPLSTGRAAFTASGAAPEVLLHVAHGASVSIAVACIDVHLCLIPLHQPPLALWRRNSLRVRWVLCSPPTFVLRTSPGEGPSPAVLVLVCVAFPRADSYAPSDSSERHWHCIRLSPSSFHLPSHPSCGLPGSHRRTHMRCCRGRVPHCPIRSLRLPRLFAGENQVDLQRPHNTDNMCYE